jgi:hypothetical protein
MWWSGLRISVGHLVNGVGLHAVETIYPAFRHVLAREPNQWHLHNQYVQIGVTRGLFGLTGFLYIFIAAFGAGYRRFRLCQDPWDRGVSGGILAALAGFLVCGLTEYCWGDSEILMLLYMLLGLMVSIPVPAPSKREPIPSEGQGSPEAAERGWGIGKSVCLGALGAIILISFLLPPVQASARVRVLELVLGAVLLYCLSGSIMRNRDRKPEVLWIVSCIVVFAAYSFTRPFWVSAEGLFQREVSSPVPLAVVLLSAAVLCFLVGWGLSRRGLLTPFDASVFAACVLWVTLALGTNVLLAFAIRSQDILTPPLVILMPLLTGMLCVYSMMRFSWEDARGERLLVACVALSMFIHAFR